MAKIDLFDSEPILMVLRGTFYKSNAIARLISKFLKLIGIISYVEWTLTDRRLCIYEENRLLWFIIVARDLSILPLQDTCMIKGQQSSSLFVFKTYNLQILSPAATIAGINLKGSNFDTIQQHVNIFSKYFGQI